MAAYKKDLILSIGPIQTTVNLHTVQSSSGPSRRIICPDHLVPLSQQYVCEEDDNHRTFSWGEWAYGMETPEGFRVLKDEEKPQPEPTNELALIPVPAQEIRDNTFEGDSMYYCQPSSKASALTWTILNRQLKTGKVSFMTRGCLRRNSKEKLWKLELFRGYPVLREIAFPDNLKPEPDAEIAEDVTVDKPTQKLVSEFIDASMSTWDDVDTTDTWQEQFEEWINDSEIVRPNVSEESATKQSPEDLIKGLQEAVKNAKK